MIESDIETAGCTNVSSTILFGIISNSQHALQRPESTLISGEEKQSCLCPIVMR